MTGDGKYKGTYSCSGNDILVKMGNNQYIIPGRTGTTGGDNKKTGGGQRGGGTYNKTVALKQQQLYDSGFYIGNSGPLKNGVDGIYGPKTKIAYDAYMSGNINCAQFNQSNNYPIPPTCKTTSTGPKPEGNPEGEINIIDPSTF
jgi:hypothetical protein